MARKTTKGSGKKAAKRPVRAGKKATRKKAGTKKIRAKKSGAKKVGPKKSGATTAGTATKSIDLLRSWSPARYSTR